MYHSLIEMDQGHHVPYCTYLGVVQQCVYDERCSFGVSTFTR